MSKQDRQGVRTAADIERKYNLKKIADIKDYTAEYGSTTIDGVTWTYEILKSGIVKMWCMVEVPYAHASMLEKQGIKFPFELAKEPMAIITINEWSSIETAHIPCVLCRTTHCTVQVINHLSSFTTDSMVKVAVFVIGRLT